MAGVDWKPRGATASPSKAPSGASPATRDAAVQEAPRRVGRLHHVEVWTTDLPAADASLGWLLERLGFDHVDLLYYHRPDGVTPTILPSLPRTLSRSVPRLNISRRPLPTPGETKPGAAIADAGVACSFDLLAGRAASGPPSRTARRSKAGWPWPGGSPPACRRSCTGR